MVEGAAQVLQVVLPGKAAREQAATVGTAVKPTKLAARTVVFLSKPMRHIAELATNLVGRTSTVAEAHVRPVASIWIVRRWMTNAQVACAYSNVRRPRSNAAWCVPT